MAQNEVARTQVIVDGKQADKTIDALKASVKSLKKEMKEATLAGDTKKADEINRKIKTLESTTRKVVKETYDYQAILKNINGASYNDLNKALRTTQAQLRKMKQTDAGYKEKEKEVKMLKQRMAELNGATRAQQSLWQRGAQKFNTFAAGIVAGAASVSMLIRKGREAVTQYNEFYRTLADVYTLMDQTTIDKYGDRVEATAKSMIEYGFATQDTNKALFDYISATGDAENVTEAMNEIMILTKAGSTDLSVAVDGVTSVMNAYGLATEQTSEVTSAFFTAQKFGKTTVAELSSNIGKVAPIAKAAGIGFQELLSALSEMTKQGISTDEAATSLRGAISALIKPGAEAKKTLEQLGIPYGTTAVKAEGLGNILRQLNEAIVEHPDEIAKAIPNIRALTGLYALSGEALDDYDMILQQVTADVGENSSLMAAYNTVMETNAEKLAQAKGKAQTLRIELGKELAPVMTQIVSKGALITKGLLAMIKFFKEYGKQVVVVTSAIVGYTVAVKSADKFTKLWTITTGVLTGKINLAKKAMVAFNLVTKLSPIGIVIGLLTAAAVAFGIYKKKTSEATEEQSNFNDELTRSEELMKNTQSIKDRAAMMEKMNKKQLESFISDLQYQIEANENGQQQMHGALKRRLEEDETLQKLKGRLQNETLNDFQRKVIDDQIKERKRFIAQDLAASNTQYKGRLSILNDYLVKATALEKNLPSSEGDDDTDVLSSKYKKLRLKLLQDYGKRLIDKETYNSQMLLLDLQYWAEKKTLEEQQGEVSVETYKGYWNAIIKVNDDMASRIPKVNLQNIKIDDDDLELPDDIELVDMKTDAEIWEEKLKNAEAYFDQVAQMADQANQIFQIQQEMQLASVEASYDRENEALEKKYENGQISEARYNAKKNQLDEQRAEEEKRIQKESAEDQFALAAASIIANTAQAIIGTWAGYATMGPAGTVAAGIQTGFITALGIAQLAQANQQKQIAMGLETGGYTNVTRAQDGRSFRAQYTNQRGYLPQTSLISESGTEFVASHQAVTNPTIKPVLDMIDVAQKKGTAGTINLPAEMQAVGYQAGGYTATGSQGAPASNGDIMMTMLSLLKLLNKQLSSPIKAYINREPDIFDAIDDYNQLQEDIS